MLKLDHVKHSKLIENAIILSCDWLVDTAQIASDELALDTDNNHGFAYTSWKGAIKGEYNAATKRWDFHCPVWHTGQAVKALIGAYRLFQNQKHLDAAKSGAEFILRNQIWDTSHPDHGLILAFEDYPDKVNTSAVLECMDGLIHLAEHVNSEEIWERLIAAADFLIEHMYVSEKGVYHDVYDPNTHEPFLNNKFRAAHNGTGRPLLDDAIMLRIYEKTGNKKFLNVHLGVARTLVNDQNPLGNWINYRPCSAKLNLFHPRQTYWWSIPLLDTYRLTNQSEFLNTAIASGQFCKRALRADGGWIRGLYRVDEEAICFNTECFGHSTSGSACAAILFMELYKQTKDTSWLEPTEKALDYCLKMQFTSPQDSNLKGAILEKVLPPDGTDCSPYYLRDLGTIFFITAAVEYLNLKI